jgi:hypothetical protein
MKLSPLFVATYLSVGFGCALARDVAGKVQDTAKSAPIAASSSGESPPEVAGPFTDNDEGSNGPVQDAHEGQVVFANVPIARKETDERKLVTSTTLTRPLYVRAYLPKTPARLLHEKGVNCPRGSRALWFFAKVEGGKETELFEMELDKYFAETRSQTITDPDAKGSVSLIPSKEFELSGHDAPELFAFMGVLANLKPGTNNVEFQLDVGCNARGVEGRKRVVASQGKIQIQATQPDISRLARLIKVRKGAPQATSRLRPLYEKLVVKGAKVLDFAADSTQVEPMVKKQSDLRILMANADKTCTYVVTRWVEPYLGGGQYDVGSVDATSSSRPAPVPCP